MNKEINIEEVQSSASEKLVGCSIDKISYCITGWELRFIHSEGEEYYLSTSEILIPNLDNWWSKVSSLPIDLKNTNEADDTISAINIFTLTNKWPVTNISMGPGGNLQLEFGNGIVLVIPALVQHVDWTWELKKEDGSNLITCDSGAFYCTE